MVETKLTKDTLMPVGLVLAFIVPLFGGAIWLNSRLQSISYDIQTVNLGLKQVRAQLDDTAKFRWTKRDMELWSQLLKAKNPNVNVPLISHE